MGPRSSATLFIVTARAVLSVMHLGPASGQAPQIRGSLSGFVFDPEARGLRPLLGSPGAATIGEPLPAGVDLRHAAVSADGDYALAIAGDGRGLLAILQLSGTASVRPLGAAASAGDALGLSPLGSYAVLYQRAAQSLQVVKGLPGAPGLAQRLDVAHLGGPLSAFAIDDRGTVLAAAPAGDTSQIYVFEKDGAAHLISTVHHAADLAFINGLDAVVADDRDHKVYLLRFVTGVTATLPLAGEAQGLAGPLGRALLRDHAPADDDEAGPPGIHT